MPIFRFYSDEMNLSQAKKYMIRMAEAFNVAEESLKEGDIGDALYSYGDISTYRSNAVDYCLTIKDNEMKDKCRDELRRVTGDTLYKLHDKLVDVCSTKR